MTRAEDVWKLSNRELWALLRAGHPIDPAALDDTVYRGVSLGLPRFIERLSWKTFQKTFKRDRERGCLRGWNVRLVQTGFAMPSTPQRLKDGRARTFGHYRVVDAKGQGVRGGVEQGLLIHYGLGGNGALDAMGPMRDPIVALDAGRSELLLGWSYMKLGPLQIGTPSFFTLEREGALDYDAPPPRG